MNTTADRANTTANPGTRRRRTGRVAALALAATLTMAPALAACGDDEANAGAGGAGRSAGAPSELELMTSDHHFDASADTVAAGPVTVRLTNEGDEPHQVQFAKVEPGTTPEEFVETFRTEGEAAALATATWHGGVNGTEPGQTQVATSVLEPGEYLMLCFIPSPGPEGKAHLMQGMVAPLTVVDTGERAAEPEASTTVGLDDYAVEIPEGFAGGAVEVVNDGAEDHELILMRLHEGKDMADLAAWSAAGMPEDRPVGYVGGTGTIEPGARAWTTLELPPGDYVALCVVQGPAHMAHAEMGMITSFTVT